MHELGHDLGLKHGGADHYPIYAPNYKSIMNYRYANSGIVQGNDYSQFRDHNPCGANSDPWGRQEQLNVGNLDYSRGNADTLDESALDESKYGIDWDCDGVPNELSVSMDLSKDSDGDQADPPEELSVTSDHNDWVDVTLRLSRHTGG